MVPAIYTPNLYKRMLFGKHIDYLTTNIYCVYKMFWLCQIQWTSCRIFYLCKLKKVIPTQSFIFYSKSRYYNVYSLCVTECVKTFPKWAINKYGARLHKTLFLKRKKSKTTRKCLVLCIQTGNLDIALWRGV